MARSSDALMTELVGNLAPVKPLRFGLGMGLTLAAAAITALITIGWFGLRADLQAGRFDPVHLMATGIYLGLAIAASVTVVVMSRPCVGTDYSGWTYAAAMAALLPAAGLIVAMSGGDDLLSAGSLAYGLNCFAEGAVATLGVFAVLVVWLRKGAPTAPDRAGLIAGIASGSFGAFALALACPDNSIVHIGVWHSAVVVAMAGVGRAVVPPLVRW